MEYPVRVSPVKIRILIYHFRLKPKAELHSQLSDTARQSGDTIRKTVPIRYPVSQACLLRTPLSEPSVIQHKELYTAFFRFPGNLQYLLLIKIHIGGFPVVDEDRTRSVSPVPSGKPLLIQAVESLAQVIQALIRVGHYSLRRLERLSRLQFPIKTVRMYSHEYPRSTVGTDLRLGEEIAAVDKTEPDSLPLELICMVPLQYNERIVLVG